MPQPSKLLVFQDFQSSKLINGYSVLLPNKQILCVIQMIFQHSSVIIILCIQLNFQHIRH